ncbi:LEA type 2 family protein [candidate division WOR-3 bacterium]|nr:LEA type 2 family protein [candidate division WOR-3 bacterium]
MKKFVLVALALLMLAGCTNQRPRGIKNCQFHLADMRTTEKELTYAKVELLIDATNPNGVEVIIDRMIFDLYANGNKIGSGASSFQQGIPPGESVKLKGKMSIDYISGIMSLWNMLESSSVSYSLGARVYYETPMGNYYRHSTISSAGFSFPSFLPDND